MLDFTYGNYAYFNDNDEITKHYIKIIIRKQEPEITIASPGIFLEGKLITLPEMFVKSMIVTWIEENVQFVAQLLIIDVWNQHIQKNNHVFI